MDQRVATVFTASQPAALSLSPDGRGFATHRVRWAGPCALGHCWADRRGWPRGRLAPRLPPRSRALAVARGGGRDSLARQAGRLAIRTGALRRLTPSRLGRCRAPPIAGAPAAPAGRSWTILAGGLLGGGRRLGRRSVGLGSCRRRARGLRLAARLGTARYLGRQVGWLCLADPGHRPRASGLLGFRRTGDGRPLRRRRSGLGVAGLPLRQVGGRLAGRRCFNRARGRLQGARAACGLILALTHQGLRRFLRDGQRLQPGADGWLPIPWGRRLRPGRLHGEQRGRLRRRCGRGCSSQGLGQVRSGFGAPPRGRRRLGARRLVDLGAGARFDDATASPFGS